MTSFDELKAGFMTVAPKFGLTSDFVAKYWEDRYLYHARKQDFKGRLRLKTIYKTYPTGRKRVPEKPELVFKTYNDGTTKPSQATLDEMKAKAQEITKNAKTDSAKLLAICKWNDTVAVYKTDDEKWGKVEFWSSPFDIWQELKEKGHYEDDCDGFSVFILQIGLLAGIPEDRLFVRCGMAQAFGKKEGHANILFDNYPDSHFYAEGSFFPKDCFRRWGQLGLQSTRYPDTWFLFNAKGSFTL
jgi:hypothetical protein